MHLPLSPVEIKMDVPNHARCEVRQFVTRCSRTFKLAPHPRAGLGGCQDSPDMDGGPGMDVATLLRLHGPVPDERERLAHTIKFPFGRPGSS
jgi:hypothetical protein